MRLPGEHAGKRFAVGGGLQNEEELVAACLVDAEHKGLLKRTQKRRRNARLNGAQEFARGHEPFSALRLEGERKIGDGADWLIDSSCFCGDGKEEAGAGLS